MSTESLDMDPGGVYKPRDPFHHETLSLAAGVTLTKENPRGEGQPLAPQSALKDIFQSELACLNWT